MYVSGKLGHGVGVGGSIFNKPKKMHVQNPVWKKKMEKYTQMTLKMGSRSYNVKYLHHVAYVYQCKITIYIEIVLTLFGVKTIAIKANNNVDVNACVT